MAQDANVRFIGETGLDWHYDLSPREDQEQAFRAQIQLARRVRKPLMIHTRSAPEATLRILWEEGAEEVSGTIHCFSEDIAFAEGALDLGFYLSFSGIVTFKNAHAVRDVAAWAPEDRILVETDSPYLAPVPYRGKTNEPAFVRSIAAHLAQLRGISSARIEELTARNLRPFAAGLPPFSLCWFWLPRRLPFGRANAAAPALGNGSIRILAGGAVATPLRLPWN